MYVKKVQANRAVSIRNGAYCYFYRYLASTGSLPVPVYTRTGPMDQS